MQVGDSSSRDRLMHTLWNDENFAPFSTLTFYISALVQMNTFLKIVAFLISACRFWQLGCNEPLPAMLSWLGLQSAHEALNTRNNQELPGYRILDSCLCCTVYAAMKNQNTLEQFDIYVV